MIRVICLCCAFALLSSAEFSEPKTVWEKDLVQRALAQPAPARTQVGRDQHVTQLSASSEASARLSAAAWAKENRLPAQEARRAYYKLLQAMALANSPTMELLKHERKAAGRKWTALKHLQRQVQGLASDARDLKAAGVLAGEHSVCLHRLVTDVLRRNISGDIVECGVYNGRSAQVLGFSLLAQKSSALLWLYDSFEGEPMSTTKDLITSVHHGTADEWPNHIL
jgi:hypothetical protein